MCSVKAESRMLAQFKCCFRAIGMQTLKSITARSLQRIFSVIFKQLGLAFAALA